MKPEKIFLFSIDLEDVRDGVVNGNQYKDRVEVNTIQYLNWLKKLRQKCTFFTVGIIAERYPDLIKQIVNEGHEIACHSQYHIPVDKQTPDSFKKDLSENINSLLKAGAEEISGFRAPVFSVIKETEWVYKIMEDCGLKYSSSVLPAKNPLYGWQEFGTSPKKMGNILEIPMSLNKFGPLTVPFAGGVYFRCLPFWWVNKSFENRFEQNLPALSYFHPYDIDVEQEQFMHGGINNSKFYNFLMYYNRASMFKRLDKVMEQGAVIMRYEDYLKQMENGI